MEDFQVFCLSKVSPKMGDDQNSEASVENPGQNSPYSAEYLSRASVKSEYGIKQEQIMRIQDSPDLNTLQIPPIDPRELVPGAMHSTHLYQSLISRAMPGTPPETHGAPVVTETVSPHMRPDAGSPLDLNTRSDETHDNDDQQQSVYNEILSPAQQAAAAQRHMLQTLITSQPMVQAQVQAAQALAQAQAQAKAQMFQSQYIRPHSSEAEESRDKSQSPSFYPRPPSSASNHGSPGEVERSRQVQYGGQTEQYQGFPGMSNSFQSLQSSYPPVFRPGFTNTFLGAAGGFPGYTPHPGLAYHSLLRPPAVTGLSPPPTPGLHTESSQPPTPHQPPTPGYPHPPTPDSGCSREADTVFQFPIR